MSLQGVGQVHAERLLQQRHILHESIIARLELPLRQLVQVAVHGALQNTPPQPAGQRIPCHAEHGVCAGVSDGGSKV